MSLDLPVPGADLDEWGDKLNAALTALDAHRTLFPDGDWDTYAPVIGGDGWALGNGVASGRCVKMGRAAHFSVVITWGSTSTYGAAAQLIVSVPFPRWGSGISEVMFVARLIQASTGKKYAAMGVLLEGQSSMFVRSFGPGGLGEIVPMTATDPFTWASGDRFHCGGTYEAAA